MNGHLLESVSADRISLHHMCFVQVEVVKAVHHLVSKGLLKSNAVGWLLVLAEEAVVGVVRCRSKIQRQVAVHLHRGVVVVLEEGFVLPAVAEGQYFAVAKLLEVLWQIHRVVLLESRGYWISIFVKVIRMTTK